MGLKRLSSLSCPYSLVLGWGLGHCLEQHRSVQCGEQEEVGVLLEEPCQVGSCLSCDAQAVAVAGRAVASWAQWLFSPWFLFAASFYCSLSVLVDLSELVSSN